jgi:hypothetical protein
MREALLMVLCIINVINNQFGILGYSFNEVSFPILYAGLCSLDSCTDILYISDLDSLSTIRHFFQFQKKNYCKFECGWALENTCSKRHGLIHFRSIKSVHSGIVSMNAIYDIINEGK